MDKSKIFAAVLIAAGLLSLGLCVRSGLASIRADERQVTVRGLCEREVDANLVTWPIVTKELGNDLPAIYNRITETNSRIVEFLSSNGLSADDYAINPPVIEDRKAQNYSQDSPVRYVATNVIVVSSSKVAAVRRLIDRIPELMREGIAVGLSDYQYPTTYSFTGLNDIKPEMITEATENARQAAQRLAVDSHSELGKIVTASQGQFSIDDRDQYTPYKKTVRVVTSITYTLRD